MDASLNPIRGMPHNPSDLIGIVGVAMIVTAYFLLQSGRWQSRGLGYLLFNLIGSSLVLASLWVDFNLSAVVIQVFWIAISLMGLVRLRRLRRGEGGR